MNLLLLYAAGKLLLNIPITWLETAYIVIFAIALDHALIYLKIRKLDFFSYSAINTALGVAFLLRTVELEIYIVAVALAISQKHLLRIQGRHFLNPSNVAVVAGLLLFPYATYTTPEQWGTMWWLGVVMTVLGLLITYRVDRILIPLVFSACYLLLTYAFITHNLTEILYTLVSGSFLLFVYFMLTDPRTTPDQPGYQALYAASIAFLTIILEVLFGAYDVTMFLSLFIVSMFVPLIRMAQQKSSRIWQYTAGTMTAVSLLLYFSPLNSMRASGLAEAPELATDSVVEQKREQAEAVSWDEKAEWYPGTWEKPYRLETPIASRPRGEGFEPVANRLNALPPIVSRRYFGHDYIMHGPVAAGDINHDGHLDLAIATLGRPLSILINRGDGTFFDAAHQLFPSPPPDYIDQIALADVDSDSYLDLIIALNPYEHEIEPNRWYRFNPLEKRFEMKGSFPLDELATIGGFAINDINDDRKLDIYISLEHNWRNQKQPAVSFMLSVGIEDQFWVSHADGWSNRKRELFPQPDEQHAGMTAVFTDLEGDGERQFLLGNDQQPDLTYRKDKGGIFRLIPKESIQYNARTSMSYFGIDADNDGTMEIWENCVSRDAIMHRTRYGEYFKASEIASGDDLFAAYKKKIARGDENCSSLQNAAEQGLCLENMALRLARREGDPTLCDNVANIERRYQCWFEIDMKRFSPARPRLSKQDAELYPRKIDKNVLLKRNDNGVYEDVLGEGSAALTGWSWAAYPYDVDNNGYQDLAVTTGMAILSNTGPLALLMNHSQAGRPQLENEAARFNVAFEDEGRGLVIGDFDGDGDGEIVINNLFTPPTFLDNKFGGNAIKVELRSRHDNYFALGSRLMLYTSRGIQTREITIGGVWDSAQPPLAHFGLADGETIEKLVIRWPSGKQSIERNLKADHHYVIFD